MVKHTDANSARFEDPQLLLPQRSAAAQLVGEDTLSAHADGCLRWLSCVEIEDVDAMRAALGADGVKFVQPLTSRSWSARTAQFADPDGNLWEIAHDIAAGAQKHEAAGG